MYQMTEIDNFHVSAYVDEGIVRWVKNNQIPDPETLFNWYKLGLPFNYTKSLSLFKRETVDFKDIFLVIQPETIDDILIIDRTKCYGD